MPQVTRLAIEHKGGVLKHSVFGAGSVTQSAVGSYGSQQKAGEKCGLALNGTYLRGRITSFR